MLALRLHTFDHCSDRSKAYVPCSHNSPGLLLGDQLHHGSSSIHPKLVEVQLLQYRLYRNRAIQEYNHVNIQKHILVVINHTILTVHQYKVQSNGYLLGT